MDKLIDQLRRAIIGRNPLIYLLSPEENRMSRVLEELASEAGDSSWQVHAWTCVTGLTQIGDPAETKDPVRALQAIQASDAKGFFMMKDLPAFMADAAVLRALRDFYYAHRGGHDRFVVIVSPELVMPDVLKKEIHLLEVAPPGEEEIKAQIENVQESASVPGLPPEYLPDVILALKGLTLSEIDHVMLRILHAGIADRAQVLDEVYAQKQMIVKKTGYLEFTPPTSRASGIGGLGNLKDWLAKRAKLFNQEALAAGVPMPKGLLIMGVSGCGKSLAVKAISELWQVPMFRLDMNLIFSKLFGSPEAAFHAALKALESVAPAVLWIDEIENGLGIDESYGATGAHVFSAFLTWMQEKPPLIFAAATANRIHALPAEIIRKGRFDQVFFVDLPNEAERKEILTIHLQNNNADLAEFDVGMLAVMMEGWTGAEIEQAVVSARVDAYYEERPFTMRDVSRSARAIVPLSTTMEEQIKGIRGWAFDRATPASAHAKVRRH